MDTTQPATAPAGATEPSSWRPVIAMILTAVGVYAVLAIVLVLEATVADVHVTSSQTLNAALRGFADARSDGIAQITTGAAQYLSGPADDIAVGARAFAELAHV